MRGQTTPPSLPPLRTHVRTPSYTWVVPVFFVQFDSGTWTSRVLSPHDSPLRYRKRLFRYVYAFGL